MHQKISDYDRKLVEQSNILLQHNNQNDDLSITKNLLSKSNNFENNEDKIELK